MTANLEVIPTGPLPKLRKPVAITENAGGHITIACDDGTVWRMRYDPLDETRDWRPVGAIPRTESRPEDLPGLF